MPVSNMEHAMFIDIGKIFSQVQDGVANHQKNKVKLYTLHERASQYGLSSSDAYAKYMNLAAFQDAFKQHIFTVLRVKKGVSGDNVIKFIAGYIEYIRLREIETNAQKENSQTDADEDTEDEDSFQDHLIRALIKFLCKMSKVKEKVVRFRTLQLFAHITPVLGTITTSQYNTIRDTLVERLTDKEANVRALAVSAFSKLVKTEDGDEGYEYLEGQEDPLTTLKEIVCHDSSSDVRREALVGLPVAREAIKLVVSRTRDEDVNVRKAVYASVLEPNMLLADGNPGTYHPRELRREHRDVIIVNGVKDREEAVRKVAGKLVNKWLECLSAKVKAEEQPIEKLLPLLSLFEPPSEAAELVLECVFETRADIFIALSFDEHFWFSLKNESRREAFLARVFVQYCVKKKKNERLEKNVPTMTDYAKTIKDIYGLHLDNLEESRDDQETKERQRILDETGIILAQLLQLANCLDDFGDENGRRALRAVVLDMLPNADLPTILIAPACKLLRQVTPDVDEKDLVRDIIDIVKELREKGPQPVVKDEPVAYDDNLRQATAGQSYMSESPGLLASELRSLSIANGILEGIREELGDDVELKQEIVAKISHPAMLSTNIELRIQGYRCLALCCLVSRRSALFHLKDFQRIATGSTIPKLCTTATQAFFDILRVHGEELFKIENNEKNVTDNMIPLLKEDNSEMQALVSQGLTKLVLAGLLNGTHVLVELMMAYLTPLNRHNNALQQCLAQFFNVYSGASSLYQRRLCDVFVECFQGIRKLHKEFGNTDDRIKPLTFVTMYAEWTNPVRDDDAKEFGKTNRLDERVQFDLANAIVKELYSEDIDKSNRKVLCQMLNKLHIPNNVDLYKLKVYKILMDNLPRRRPLDDASKKEFNKYVKTVNDKFGQQLEPLSYDDMRQMEELRDLFTFVDDLMEESDGTTKTTEKAVKRGRSADSIFSDDHPRSVTPKRRRVSYMEGESDDLQPKREPSVELIPNPASTSRRSPQRSGATTRNHTYDDPIVISSDSEDELDATPRQKQKPVARPTRKRKTASPVPPHPPPPDSDDDGIEMPYDSIMDDSEDEEGQVLNLLAGSDE